MSGITDEAGNIFNDTSRTLAPKAVAFQVILMSVVSIVTILAFNVLRPKNKVIYEPKVKYHDIEKPPPPRISDGLFGWLSPLIHTKEPELLEKVGLDAVAFLRFTRLMRSLFTCIAVLACAVTIPVNVIYNLRNVKASKRDILSILTIRDVSGNLLYVHVAVTYVVTLMVIAFVYYHWKEMVRLRHTWFRSPEYQRSFYARTVSVRNVPRKNQSDEGLKAIFDSIQMPYPTTSVHMGRRFEKLAYAIEEHNRIVREFEAVLVGYLKKGRIGKKRPTLRVGATCGIGGRKVDAIDFYTERIKRAELRVDELRQQHENRKAENYGFASLAAVPYAHIVARKLEGKRPKGTTIALAPNPKDIVWENMNKSSGEIFRKKAIGFVWLAVVCFVNTVPLFVISILANLATIQDYVPFLDSWADASPTSFAFVSGVLPPAVSGIFGFFLPIVMRWLTKYMGALTHSRLDRAVIARYFFFLIISQLVIFTLIGVIFNSVKEIIEQIGRKASAQEILNNLHKLPATVHKTYINQSSYWLTFFPLRGFLVIFDLAQIINLIWIFIKTRLFGRTPRDIREWTQPPEFQYAIYYSNILFMGAVGLVFTPLAPLVAVAAAIVFWIGSWIYKYQLMYVFVSKVESGGRLWNVVINRLLFCVLLMQALMILTIGLQFSFRSLRWLSTVPPFLFIFAFKIYVNRTFVPAFTYYIPNEEELRLARVHSERADHGGNRLEKRFGHPSLQEKLFTPMLHEKMMPLLSQVYSGRLAKDEANLGEYGGQKMEAQVVPGGIKIAGISQNELAYDPALYQRDRGELDWDARSMTSTNMLDGASVYNGTVGSTTKLVGYDNYLAHGPQGAYASEIELAKLDTMNEPLLSPRTMSFHQSQGSLPHAHQSQGSLSHAPALYQQTPVGSMREAPTHRPQQSYARQLAPSPAPSYQTYGGAEYPPRQYTPTQEYPPRTFTPTQEYPPRTFTPTQEYPSRQSPSPYGHHPRQSSTNNMAGRGAFRG